MDRPIILLNDYQHEAMKTFIATGDSDHTLARLALGIAGEAGEIAEIVKKSMRGDYKLLHKGPELAKELGDVMWYVACFASGLQKPLSEIATLNINKLANRKERGVIQGSGSSR